MKSNDDAEKYVAIVIIIGGCRKVMWTLAVDDGAANKHFLLLSMISEYMIAESLSVTTWRKINT